MSRSEKLHVFCYDVSDNKRRRRIAKILEDHASRVQYSVFEGRLTRARVVRIVKEVEDLLEKGDSLRVYAIGRPGEKRSSAHGTAAPIEDGAGYWLY